jgi:DNA polymerase III subunit epsilon
MEFVAIDFETANPSRSSICAVGIAISDGSSVLEHDSWLIDPRENFSPHNVRVHGIRASDVAGAPTFRDQLPRMLDMIGGRPLLAHNAGFDISCIRKATEAYRLDFPSLPYQCTQAISKKAWPGRTSYKLNLVCEELGIRLDNHHDAGADALACMEVALAACRARGGCSIEEILTSLGLVWKSI